MVKFCAVVGCANRSNKQKDHSFFRIPVELKGQCPRTLQLSKDRRNRWLANIGRKDLTDKDVSENTRVCSDHFHTGKPSALFDATNPDWAPALKMRPTTVKAPDTSRYARVQERRQKQQQRVPLQELQEDLEHPEDMQVDLMPPDPLASLHQMQGERDQLLEERKQLSAENEKLSRENKLLSLFPLTKDSLRDDDEKVHFYTGLPTFTLLMHVFNLCEEFIETSYKNALPKFEEFLIVLMRLRLNLLEEDLAYRFVVSQPTVSRILTRWLEVLHLRLQGFILWPEREVLQKSMPECFLKVFGRSLTVILDCFEVFIERPSSQLGAVATFSSYKHHNTVKVLVGITPQGTFSFVSQAYVGRTSDTLITNESGILDKLKPGDVVLADRGFNVGETVGVLRARIVQPAFLNGRPQLAGMDVDETRKIANLRVHVERLIGFVRRKYRILSDLLPADSLIIKEGQTSPPIDQILVTACALCNLCPPIIPMFLKREEEED